MTTPSARPPRSPGFSVRLAIAGPVAAFAAILTVAANSAAMAMM